MTVGFELPKEFSPDFLEEGVKPVGEVEIDWSNPLTAGLQSVLIAGAPVDLCTKQSLAIVNVNTIDGAWNFTAGSNHARNPAINGVAEGGFTFAAVGRSALPDDLHRRFFTISDADDINKRFSLGINGYYFRYNANNGSNQFVDVTFDTGVRNADVRIGAIERGTSRVLVVDGDYKGRSSQTSSSGVGAYSVYDTAAIGGWYKGSLVDAWVGRGDIAVIWSADIGEQALSSFLKNPYQILKPKSPQLYIVPATGGTPPDLLLGMAAA